MKRGSLRIADLHWPLIIVTMLIAVLGIYNLHSAAAARDPELYLTQAIWVGIASLLVVGFLVVDYRVTESLAYPIFIIVVVLLLVVLGQGHIAKGASRWLHLGPVRFQPSELAKLAVVFCLARYFCLRMRSGGYSIALLVRPLNPSRPLAAITALVVLWNQPWLADPLGQLARSLRRLNPVPGPPGDFLWFRLLTLFAVAAFSAALIVAVVRYERRIALLNPWPQERKRRVIGVIVLMSLIALSVVVWYWRAPVLRDPVGVLVAHLVHGAAEGGPYAKPSSGMVLRVVLAICVAIYLGLSLWSLRKGAERFSDIVIAPADLILMPAGLILLQPDLGTAGVVILVGLSLMLVVGMRLSSLVVLFVCGVVFASIGWTGVLKEYQKQRILTFIDPEQDTQGAGWNAVQSMIAVGSGQWTGKGHKGGTQTQLFFLPEQHTDFAFSVWAEEEGFLGSLLMVALYVALVVMGLSIVADAREHYGGLLAMGATAIVFWQAVINMSMVVGLFPVVGITLPLFSYGGSSVITVMLSVGVLLSVHWRRRAHGY